MSELLQLLGQVIPNDHANQIHARDALAMLLKESDAPKLLDLGCGDGRALDVVQQNNPAAHYTGVDIEDSPEVRSRSRADAVFVVFDGVNLPFEDAKFDVVYSCSVLEHVRHPDRLLPEVARVLRPGGTFLGSVSFLEPYHSYSIFNFTPFGLATVLREAGLEVRWMRPGIDGVSLTLRSLGMRRQFNRWFHSESPLNKLIHFRKRMRRRSFAEENATKLSVAGQLVFAARRPLR